MEPHIVEARRLLRVEDKFSNFENKILREFEGRHGKSLALENYFAWPK